MGHSIMRSAEAPSTHPRHIGRPILAYVAANYMSHKDAPAGKWVCAPTSTLGPLPQAPTGTDSRGPHFCGQCVSYVKTVCPSLPATSMWKRGPAIKGSFQVLSGTVIATFNEAGQYEGHAAIYVNQHECGINVYDQWLTPPTPKAVGPRLLRFGASVRSNNGDLFHVVE